MAEYPFLKGHGTENDFVLLPDHDGKTHGSLPAERVQDYLGRVPGAREVGEIESRGAHAIVVD